MQMIHREIFKRITCSNFFQIAILACVVFVTHVTVLTGQENASPDDDSIVPSPDHTFFFSERRGLIVRRQVTDNIKLPIDRIRFLARKAIQEDLGLDEQTIDGLKNVMSQLDEYEFKLRWDYFAVPESVSRDAKLEVGEFIKRLVELESQGLISKEQIARIDQIRLQFACLGVVTDHRLDSPFARVRSHLKLNEEQKEKVAEIVRITLEDELRFKSCFDEIVAQLNPKQAESFEHAMQPYYERSIQPAYLLAQCREFYEYSKGMKPGDEGDFDSMLLGPILFTLDGSFASEDQYLESGMWTNVHSPWVKILDSILNGQMSWLELSGEQLSQLSALKTLKKNSNGRLVLSYYGNEELKSVGKFPEQHWSMDRYQDWTKTFRQAKKKCDRLLGEKMEETLLPHQIESIRMALAIARVNDLGPYHVVERYCTPLKLTNAQLKSVEQLRVNRNKLLLKKFAKIDKECRRLLTPEQKSILKANLGDPVEFYPCFWIFY